MSADSAAFWKVTDLMEMEKASEGSHPCQLTPVGS